MKNFQEPEEDTDVFLVSSVQMKKPTSEHPLTAKELFNSPWFRQCRRYVESTGKPWYIICGKNGIVHPDDILSDYQFTFSSLTLRQRREWGNKASEDLIKREDLFPGCIVTMFCSEMYYTALFDSLDEKEIVADQPLESMNMGLQLRWFRDRVGYENPKSDPRRPRRKYTKKK